MTSSLRARLAASAALPLMIVACGGDAGSPPPPPPPSSGTNSAPTIVSGATATVEENNRLAYIVDARDADGNNLTYTIAGGADAAKFAFTGNQLSFAVAPNFDLPADADANNIYDVQISVSDGIASVAKALVITVTNSKEGIAVARFAQGYTEPTFVTPVPGSSSLFVLEKSGRIFTVDSNGNRSLWRTITDISTAGEGGLLGLAPAPDYATTQRVFIFVVAQDGDIELRLLEGPRSTAAPGFTSNIIPHPGFTNHYGGWMGLGPDGFIYVATGDGGGAGDPNNNAQNVRSKLGKMLRFQYVVDPYAGASVPVDGVFLQAAPGNPFYTNFAGDRAIFALGLRNPFRASFDGNDLLIGDVGQDELEEINRLDTKASSATNFGWPFREGTRPYRGTPSGALTDPVLQYAHGNGRNQGNSITMGLRAQNYPGLKYLFADFVSGNVWNFNGDFLVAQTVGMDRVENRREDFEPDAGTIDRPVSFTTGRDGLVYILDYDGELFRVGRSN